MSSSTPMNQESSTPPSEQGQFDLHRRKMEDYEKFKHYAALGMIVLAPTLAIMPPRKLDLYTVALSTGFVASASQLSKERYGYGLVDLAGWKYEEYRKRKIAEQQQHQNPTSIREQTTKSDANTAWAWTSSPKSTQPRILDGHPSSSSSSSSPSSQQSLPSESSPKPAKQSLWQRIWMGDESPNWREERAKEHAEALESGQTVGDLIRSQVEEVWEGWGGRSEEKKKEKGQGEEEK